MDEGEGRKDKGVIRRYEGSGWSREEKRLWRRREKIDESRGRK